MVFVWLVVSPVFIRWADRFLEPIFSKWIAFVVLIWIGFVFYLFFFCVVFDLIRLIFRWKSLTSKKVLLGALALALGFSVYSYYETLGLEVIRLQVKTDKLPSHIEQVKIMQVSDLHLGPLLGKEKIELVKKVWEREKPDLILETGDLVDGNMRKKDYLAEELAKITAPLGKYAIMGNHEYYRGWREASEFIERSGFKLLKDQVEVVGGFLVIAGLDDKDCRYAKACTTDFDEIAFLSKLPRDKFVLVLKHQPLVKKETLGYFDLMLSGHTHGGLYRPIGSFLVRFLYETDRGLKYLGKGSYLFVSKGVGTGGPPMRFLTPPDVVIIELINLKKEKQPKSTAVMLREIYQIL
ncbi:metallophosphoesterase [Thermodesulfobacterium sp. TA1]|uniref:metallophosphoesterase n=1 Tax=Thermodesulfobacterium sp. TA1 TaxID=2234087 RepID=UPI001F0D99BB|nr:metallophosphoesterase [Thermodesulfobacterium sp. TA1]